MGLIPGNRNPNGVVTYYPGDVGGVGYVVLRGPAASLK